MERHRGASDGTLSPSAQASGPTAMSVGRAGHSSTGPPLGLLRKEELPAGRREREGFSRQARRETAADRGEAKQAVFRYGVQPTRGSSVAAAHHAKEAGRKRQEGRSPRLRGSGAGRTAQAAPARDLGTAVGEEQSFEGHSSTTRRAPSGNLAPLGPPHGGPPRATRGSRRRAPGTPRSGRLPQGRRLLGTLAARPAVRRAGRCASRTRRRNRPPRLRATAGGPARTQNVVNPRAGAGCNTPAPPSRSKAPGRNHPRRRNATGRRAPTPSGDGGGSGSPPPTPCESGSARPVRRARRRKAERPGVDGSGSIRGESWRRTCGGELEG